MTVPEPRRAHHDATEPAWCAAAVPDAAHGLEVLTEVHRWCEEAMAAGSDVPPFGSREWSALPDGRVKSYSAVRAALAWWTEQWARADTAAHDHVESSHAVAAGEDWRRVSQQLMTGRIARSYIPQRD